MLVEEAQLSNKMPCMHCGNAHWSSKCKDLARPPDGFSKENGGGGHGGDDEEEKVVFKDPWSQRGVQNGSQGDGLPSKLRVRPPSNHAFPNKPSSVVV